jgi:hypothetical protein
MTCCHVSMTNCPVDTPCATAHIVCASAPPLCATASPLCAIAPPLCATVQAQCATVDIICAIASPYFPKSVCYLKSRPDYKTINAKNNVAPLGLLNHGGNCYSTNMPPLWGCFHCSKFTSNPSVLISSFLILICESVAIFFFCCLGLSHAGGGVHYKPRHKWTGLIKYFLSVSSYPQCLRGFLFCFGLKSSNNTTIKQCNNCPNPNSLKA